MRQVLALVEHKHDRIERVLGEELSPPDDYRDKANRISEKRNQILPAAAAEHGANGGDGQARQSEGEAACEAGESQAARRAFELFPRVLDSGMEDLRRTQPPGFRAQFMMG